MKPAPSPSIDVRPQWAKVSDARWIVMRRQHDRSWHRVYGPATHADAERAWRAFEKRYPQHEYALVGQKRA